MRAGPVSIAPPFHLLPPDRRDHGLDAEDVERPPQIVGERRQAELSSDVVEAPHQEGALVHPLLDRAEGVLDDLATAIEDTRPGRYSLSHAIERVLVFETGNRTDIVCATGMQRAIAAGFRVCVVDLFHVAQSAVADRRQRLAGRANIGVALGVVAELVLAEKALAHSG